MATYAELTELFSTEGIVRLSKEDALANKVPEHDAQTLADVGLPAQLDVIFSLDVPGEPAAFTLVPIDTGEGVVHVLSLGGPAGSTDMRYCLDLDDGYVILLSLGEEPGAEIVNTSLPDFIEFLYRFGLRLKDITGVTDEQADQYTIQLRAYLEAKDPQAFAESDSWWSMVFDRLMGEEF
ncbi:SUKH-4 family immunity protein [Streptomyces leeuwenhoekii]|uniref:SUKH-4 family immunity protein n=1 Tax=Streptomyces leeuwenhoekii TaxID=1437453 RepID=UPI00368C36CF